MVEFSGGRSLALAVILAGCKQAPPLPAPDTHDADVKAIRDLETSQLQGFAARDLDKICAYYADDGSVLSPDAPVITGVAAIRASYKTLLADKNYSVNFSPEKDMVEVAKSGDLGYAQGGYTMTMTDPKTKKVLTVNGKYVEVFRKQADGGWKAVEDIINEDAPPVPVKK